MVNTQSISPFLDAIKAKLPAIQQFAQMPYGNFILANFNTIICAVLVVVGLYRVKSTYDQAKLMREKATLPAPDFPEIDELEKFDWKSSKPAPLRPLEFKNHISMVDASGFHELDPSNLIIMDSSYRDRINARRFLLQQNINRAVGLNDRDDRVAEAVTELYTFLMGSYLPRRFPSMFKCHQVEFETGQQYMLQNLPMGDMTPARGLVPPEGTTPIRSLLVNLGRHLDEDFVFLLPGRYEKPGRAKYILEAYVTCCLYGFDPSQRLGKVMQDLRRPATSYDDGNKLESSMDRLLNRLENGKYLQRNIWSVAMKSDLFQPDTRKDSAKKPEFSGDLKPDETFVRVERQTMHRLPRSKAVVLAYKTYLYSLRQIKEEEQEQAERLIGAIDEMQRLEDGDNNRSSSGGGAGLPETEFYLGGERWGQAIREYLTR